MHIPFFIYLGLCLVVAVMGMNRKMGFYGYLFASIVLTPLIGGLLVLVSGPRKQ